MRKKRAGHPQAPFHSATPRIIALLFAVVALAIFLELSARIILASPALCGARCSLPAGVGGDAGSVEDAKFGYSLPKGTEVSSEKRLENGSLIYNVTYRYDSSGRRQSSECTGQEDNRIYLLGDSLFFGEGLSDNGTVQAILSESLGPSWCILNYAVPGYGPQHALIETESRLVSEPPANGRNIGIYVFTGSHIYRSVLSTRTPWLLETEEIPYYIRSPSGNLSFHTSFRDERPFEFSAYSGFLWLKRRSAFLSLSRVDLPLFSTGKAIDLSAEILSEASGKFLNFSGKGGNFFVLIHPCGTDGPESASVKEALMKKGVSVLDYSGLGCPDSERLPFDPHPGERLNGRLAPEMAESILAYSPPSPKVLT